MISDTDYSALENKRILITGISGFIGSNLSRELSKYKAAVYGISSTKRGKKILRSNILDFSRIESFVKRNKIQICFHLAGHSLVESGQKDPFNTFFVNVQGTLNMLEIGKKHKFEKLIIASSSHVYGKNRVPYYEGYTPRPSRPYETSKACTDLIAQSYAETFNLPIFVGRFVNVYGPGDLNFNRIIPNAMKHIHLRKKMSFWGGDVLRDYLYIGDAIDAFLRLSVSKRPVIGSNRIFNFGGGNPISVRDLLAKIIFHAQKPLSLKKVASGRQMEIKSQFVSFAKARKILNWNPTVNLDEGLKKSLVWYREYFNDHKNIS